MDFVKVASMDGRTLIIDVSDISCIIPAERGAECSVKLRSASDSVPLGIKMHVNDLITLLKKANFRLYE